MLGEVEQLTLFDAWLWMNCAFGFLHGKWGPQSRVSVWSCRQRCYVSMSACLLVEFNQTFIIHRNKQRSKYKGNENGAWAEEPKQLKTFQNIFWSPRFHAIRNQMQQHVNKEKNHAVKLVSMDHSLPLQPFVLLNVTCRACRPLLPTISDWLCL